MICPFIKAAEVWLPSEDGQLLEFGSGTFGTARWCCISDLLDLLR